MATPPLSPLSPARLRPLLGARRFGAVIEYAERLPSTQEAALAAARAGAAEGAVFLAGSQSRGRGRHGHAWDSPPEAGLYASLVLRPRLSPAEALPLTLALGLAVADAVAEACAVAPELRWPNDLLLGGKKFAGLLLETSGDGDRVAYAVLGIGINVQARAFPPELEPIATAVNLHARRPAALDELCAAVLTQCERRYDRFLAGGRAGVLAEFNARCRMAQDQPVIVGGAGPAPFTGRTAGVNDDGFLRIRLADGSERLVTHGDVRPEK